MRKWLRPDWRARLLDLFACFLIPLYTLLFTHDTRWFTTNFSVIAAARDQRHGFFLWGMLVGVYLLCVLLPVMAALPRPLWPRLCLLGGFLLLLSAVVLPYTPDELPKIADLHVICAFTASCLLVLSLFLLLLQKARQDRQRYWDCILYEVAGSDGAALPGAVRDGGDHQQRAGDIFRPLHYPAGPAAVVSGAGRWKKLKHF